MKKGIKIKHLKEIINTMDDDLEVYIEEIDSNGAGGVYNIPVRSITREEQIGFDEFSEDLSDKNRYDIIKCNKMAIRDLLIN